jgi:hypothetical protein
MLTALTIALVVAPLSAIGAWLRRRDRLRVLLMTVVLAAVGLWLVLIGVALTGWRDLDGAIDCWPHCSTEQEAVKVVFWAAPLTALVFAVASVASLLRR